MSLALCRAQVPNPNRAAHPSIADIVPAITLPLHGTAPMFQYHEATPAWNHGEGFAPPTPPGVPDADYGGWFNVTDGTGVRSADVHTTFDWQPWTWNSEVHPAAPHQMLRFVGYLRPSGLPRKSVHPLYGNLTAATTSSGPFEITATSTKELSRCSGRSCGRRRARRS